MGFVVSFQYWENVSHFPVLEKSQNGIAGIRDFSDCQSYITHISDSYCVNYLHWKQYPIPFKSKGKYFSWNMLKSWPTYCSLKQCSLSRFSPSLLSLVPLLRSAWDIWMNNWKEQKSLTSYPWKKPNYLTMSVLEWGTHKIDGKFLNVIP